ncbi:hypothetical protein H0H92_010960 [Tricholoma furcatifolium]|nr:hypothetical protein H0H92_010960 [Tricholoma furcatifolium]
MFRTSFRQLHRPISRLYSTITQPEVEALNKWILSPNEIVLSDTFNFERLSDLYITLPTRDGSRQPYLPPKVDSPLGYAHHIAFFHSRTPEAELREDGTETDFSPPAPFTRRMWAGGKMVWNPDVPLMIGQRAKATWGIDSVQKKGFDDPSKSPMVFVNQRIDVTMEGNSLPSLTEERSHVYFTEVPQDTAKPRKPREGPHYMPIVKGIPSKSDFSFTYKPSLATLFRYSALMFNAHSIHLDLAYTQKEGYPERLVHGPLTATMLLETAIYHHPGVQIASFEYRAQNPVIVNRESTIHGVWDRHTSMKLWCVDEDGVPASTAGKAPASTASKAPAKTEGAKKTASKSKTAAPADGEKKKRRKVRKETYSSYIYKVLKQVHPDTGISNKAMAILNSFVNDIFERIATEASKLASYSKKSTISSREIQTSVRLILPGELAKHAISEGTKSVTKFSAGGK